MGWEGWFTLAVVGAMLVGLARYAHLADVIFMGGLCLVTLAGVVTPGDALAGFKNEGMLTVGGLFVVAAGLVQTGFLTRVTQVLLGSADSSRTALRRIVPAATFSSAFLNNTTVVAMGMPPLLEWSRKKGIPTSGLLLPLSYASIVGGVCTLIGTSTNLVMHGLMQQSGVPSLTEGLGMWELSRVGVPIAIASTFYLVFVTPHLLPERKEFLEQLGETRREYVAEVMVDASCPLIGKTVQVAGLRGLHGLFLIEIDRGEEIVSPVGPEERLQAGDRLVFTGVVGTIADLQRIPGLKPATEVTYDVSSARQRARRLCEAVISSSSPLIGRGIRQANFRATYDAAVVAVHRNGHRLGQKIGDVRLEPGDTLLLQTGSGFARGHRNNPDFFLVSEVGESAPIRHERAWVAAALAGALVLLMTLPDVLLGVPGAERLAAWLDDQRVILVLGAAGLMVVTRSISAVDARRSVEWSILVTIAASFGIGTAMAKSGAAAAIARLAIDFVPAAWGAAGILAGIYLLTWALTELMSNNAAAALMFPIAVSTAQQVDASPRAFAIAVTIAASAGFLMPIGYQTHLMVFGPGGYRVRDFLLAGAPMVVLWFLVSIFLIPRIWL